MCRNLRALVTKNSMKERFRTAQNYLQKLKFLVEDVSVFEIACTPCNAPFILGILIEFTTHTQSHTGTHNIQIFYYEKLNRILNEIIYLES